MAYVLDVAVQFRTGYLEQGIMVHDSRKLAVNYVRSRAFLFDLSCLLPVDWLLLSTTLATGQVFLSSSFFFAFLLLSSSRSLPASDLDS